MKEVCAMNKERAAVMVEFALGALLFFLLLIGIVDLGWMYHRRSEQEYAANQVVQLAAVIPGIEGAVAPSATNDGATEAVVNRRLRERASEVLRQSNGLSISNEYTFSKEPFAVISNADSTYTADFDWVKSAIEGDHSTSIDAEQEYVRFSYPVCKELDGGKCKVFTNRKGEEVGRLGTFSVFLPAHHEGNDNPTKEALEQGLKTQPILAAIELDQSQSFLVNFFKIGNAKTRIFASAFREQSTDSNMPLALGCDGKPLDLSGNKTSNVCPHKKYDGAYCDWGAYDAEQDEYENCWCDTSLGFAYELGENGCECASSQSEHTSYVENQDGSIGCHCEENPDNPCDKSAGLYFDSSSCGCVLHTCCVSSTGDDCLSFTTFDGEREVCDSCKCGLDQGWEWDDDNQTEDGRRDCSCVSCKSHYKVNEDSHKCECVLKLAVDAEEGDDPENICNDHSIIVEDEQGCRCEECGTYEIVDTIQGSDTYNRCLCNLALYVNKDKAENENKDVCETNEYYINDECNCVKCDPHKIANSSNECECNLVLALEHTDGDTTEACAVNQTVNKNECLCKDCGGYLIADASNNCVCNLTSLPMHTEDDGKYFCKNENEIVNDADCTCKTCEKSNYVAVSDSECACKYIQARNEGDEANHKYEDGKYACKGMVVETENGCECKECTGNYIYSINNEGDGYCKCNLTSLPMHTEGDGKNYCSNANEIVNAADCTCKTCEKSNYIAVSDSECACKYVQASSKDDNGENVCKGTIRETENGCECVTCDDDHIYTVDSNGNGYCACNLVLALNKKNNDGKKACGTNQTLSESECECENCARNEVATVNNQCECKYVAPRNKNDKTNKKYSDNKVACNGVITDDCKCLACDEASGAKYDDKTETCFCPDGYRTTTTSNGKIKCECDVTTLSDPSCDSCNKETDPTCANAETVGQGLCKSHTGVSKCISGILTCELQENELDDYNEECGDDEDRNCDGRVGEVVLCCSGATDAGNDSESTCRVITGKIEGNPCSGNEHIKYATSLNSPIAGSPCQDDTREDHQGVCTARRFVCSINDSGVNEFRCENINNASRDDNCDGVDDDCDGTPDDDYPTNIDCPVPNEQGLCAEGKKRCVQNSNGSGASEVCQQTYFKEGKSEECDKKDNDCDGLIDAADPDLSKACDTGKDGICANGQRECTNGEWGECVAPTPADEECDGIDNDCDGTPDNNIPESEFKCPTGKSGECAVGTRECNGHWGECVAPTPTAETCDGLDNDCNGVIDDGIQCDKVCNNEQAGSHFVVNSETKGCYCDADLLRSICGEQSFDPERCTCGDVCVGDLVVGSNGSCVCPGNQIQNGTSCGCGEAELSDDGETCKCADNFREYDSIEGKCNCILNPTEDICGNQGAYYVDEEHNECNCGSGCGNIKVRTEVLNLPTTMKVFRCHTCKTGYKFDRPKNRCICDIDGGCGNGDGDGTCPRESYKIIYDEEKDEYREITPQELDSGNYYYDRLRCAWRGSCTGGATVGITKCTCPLSVIRAGEKCACPVNKHFIEDPTSATVYACECDEDKYLVDDGHGGCECGTLHCNGDNRPLSVTKDKDGRLFCDCGDICENTKIAIGTACEECKGDAKIKTVNGVRQCACENDIQYNPEDGDNACSCSTATEARIKQECESKHLTYSGGCRCGNSCLDYEICGNGIDDDCNESTTDLFDGVHRVGDTCHEGQGACLREGTYQCIDGGIKCNVVAGESEGPDDDCDGIDDDCNGVIDDALRGTTGYCPYVPEGGRPADTNEKNVCYYGVHTCTGTESGWSECVRDTENYPQKAEDCNGLDDDCDDVVDEDLQDISCDVSGQQGPCKEGTRSCINENGQKKWTECTSSYTRGSEVCDNEDHDCDGDNYNGFSYNGLKVGSDCDNGLTDDCRRTGKVVCSTDGSEAYCNYERIDTNRVAEICDNKDNNCDGRIDENFPDKGGRCTVGVGKCKVTGHYVCKSDGSGVECDAQEGAVGQWNCNSSDDNDCNGVPDNQEGDALKVGSSCRPDGVQNECGTVGTYQCKSDGTGIECVGYSDNDANGSVITESCSVSEDDDSSCPGTRTCINGSWTACEYTPEARANCCGKTKPTCTSSDTRDVCSQNYDSKCVNGEYTDCQYDDEIQRENCCGKTKPTCTSSDTRDVCSQNYDSKCVNGEYTDCQYDDEIQRENCCGEREPTCTSSDTRDICSQNYGSKCVNGTYECQYDPEVQRENCCGKTKPTCISSDTRDVCSQNYGSECVNGEYTDCQYDDNARIENCCGVEKPACSSSDTREECVSAYDRECDNGSYGECKYSGDAVTVHCCGVSKPSGNNPCDNVSLRGVACDYEWICDSGTAWKCQDTVKENYDCGRGKHTVGCDCVCDITLTDTQCGSGLHFDNDTCGCACDDGRRRVSICTQGLGEFSEICNLQCVAQKDLDSCFKNSPSARDKYYKKRNPSNSCSIVYSQLND